MQSWWAEEAAAARMMLRMRVWAAFRDSDEREVWTEEGREGQAAEKSDLFSVKLEILPHLPPAQPTAESITTCQDETKAMQHNKGMT